MGQTDLALCRLADLFQADLVPALLSGQVEVLGVEPTRLEIVQRQTDNVVRALVDGVETIVHVEFVSCHRGTVPVQVLVYNALLRQRYHPLPVRSVVVYLMHDRRRPVPRGIRRRPGDDGVEFTYDVFCPWEHPITLRDVERKPVLAPLAALTPGIGEAELRALPQVVLRSRRLPRSKKGELLALTYFLAARRFEAELLQSFVESPIMQESSTYRLVMEKGRAEGRAEGRDMLRKKLLRLVRTRLGRVPRGVSGRLAGMELEALGRLFDQALEATSAQELRALLSSPPRRG
jgi:hypothetical protein